MVHRQQRAIICLIYNLRQHGYKLQAICNYLNSYDMKTSRGGRWHPTTVKKIIDENSGIIKV